MRVRAIAAIAVAALLAIQVVRNAVVSAFADVNPGVATKAWKGHPASEIGLAMTEIAKSSRARKPVPQWAFTDIRDAAGKAPLAPEPFLVRGVQASLAGENVLAQRAFEAAQWRDPRSLPSAYFLAESYLRRGDVGNGLRETAVLAQLSPGGVSAVVPYLAQYAASPANWPPLRALFESYPSLAQLVLVSLGSDIKTVPAALALANPHQSGNQQWMSVVVNTLVGAGDYPRARSVWMRIAGPKVAAGELVHDTTFSDNTSPVPFNWQLTSSTVGLAERQRGGRLHVLYYGDEDGTLASQLLLLPAGYYRLSMKLAGDPARARSLTWAVWCDKGAQPLASVTLDVAAAHGWQFQVPGDCRAQWLKLSGVSGDVAQQVDVSISDLTLWRDSPRA